MPRVSPTLDVRDGAEVEPPLASSSRNQQPGGLVQNQLAALKLLSTYWQALCLAVSPQEVKDRLKSQWSTLALVSALLVTLTIPYIISPALGGSSASDDEANNPLVQAHVILLSVSGILSISLVFFCSYMLAEIDLCSSDGDIIDFITTFHGMQQLIWSLFHLSIHTLMAAILLALHYSVKAFMAWVITGTTLALGMLVFYSCNTVDRFVKLKLAALQNKRCSADPAATAAQAKEPKAGPSQQHEGS